MVKKSIFLLIMLLCTIVLAVPASPLQYPSGATERCTESIDTESGFMGIKDAIVEKFLIVVDKDIPFSDKYESLKSVIGISIFLFIALNILILLYFTLESQTSFLKNHPILHFLISFFRGSQESPDTATLKELRYSVFDFIQQKRITNSLKLSVQNMWSWLIVGEDYRLKYITVEYAIAGTWLLRFGITALVFCVGFFLMLPLEGLDPFMRIAIAIATGFVLVLIGLFNVDKKFHIVATGFIGGGVAAFYLTTFASGTIYNLVTPITTYLLVAAVTALTSYLAIRVNSMLIALLGIVGAYVSPIALELQSSNLTLLNVYTIIITAGVLWISLFKHWKLLSYVALFFSWILATGSLNNYDQTAHFLGTIITLTTLFVLHTGIVYYYNILKKQKTTILETIPLLLNCLFFSLFGTYIVKVTHGDEWQWLIPLFTALFMTSQLYLFLFRKVTDKLLYVTLIAIIGFFAVYTIPMLTNSVTLTLSWALLSFFFLWVGLKIKSNALITVANIVMIIFYARLMVVDVLFRYLMDSGESHLTPTSEIIHFSIILTIIFSISHLYRNMKSSKVPFYVEAENDTPYPISFNAASDIAYWLGVASSFIIGYIWAVGVVEDPVLQQTVLTGLWSLLGVFVLYRFNRTNQIFIVHIALCILIITLCKFLIIDLPTWKGEFSNTLSTFVGHAATVGIIELFLFYFIRSAKKLTNVYVDFYKFLGVVFHLMIVIYLTIDISVICMYNLPAFQSGSISILWSLFALMYLKLGITHKSKGWRYLGLVLFGATIVKVLFIDIENQELLYKLITFMIMGIFLISGAFIYIGSMEQKSTPQTEESKKENATVTEEGNPERNSQPDEGEEQTTT